MTQAVLTIADNNGSSFVYTETTPLTFKVTVVDPCAATTINVLVPDSSAVTVVAGLTSFIEWDVPYTAVDDANAGFDLCHGVVFEVYTDTSDSALTLPWALITTEDTGKIRLTIDTTQDLDLISDEPSVTYTLQVKTYLELYDDRLHYTEITVTINEAECDCQYLLWT